MDNFEYSIEELRKVISDLSEQNIRLKHKYLDEKQENKKLREINEEHRILNGKLRNDWNELKEYLKERQFVYNITGEDLDEDLTITEILEEVNEIEGGDE